jgi:hypothetical protein
MTCEPYALTRITTHKGGGLWLTICNKHLELWAMVLDFDKHRVANQTNISQTCSYKKFMEGNWRVEKLTQTHNCCKLESLIRLLRGMYGS